MKNFLDNILDFDEFKSVFIILYHKTRKEANMFKLDLKQIEEFQPSTRLGWFGFFMQSIFRQFEAVEDEYITKQELEDDVKEAYLKFHNFEYND